MKNRKIKDNDPREISRILTITDWPNDTNPHFFAVDAYGTERRYLKRRLFTDGNPRKSGFSLIDNVKHYRDCSAERERS